MSSLVLRSGHVIDPVNGVDRIADVVIDDGRVLGVDVDAPAVAETVDVSGSYVSPGWIDAHTHVYGDIGLDDPDTAGVLAGVTTVIDAGSSGSLTVDEFMVRTARCRTDVRAVLYLDRRGIADTANIPTRVQDIPSVPIGELRHAIDTHGMRIVAVKTGIYADLGVAWIRLAMAAAELVGRPLYVHIGNFNTHTSSDVDMMRELLDTLRPGDVVTHCYTAQPGNLLDTAGQLLPEALDASARGVVFDLGHSGAGFEIDVARTALAAGLAPTTVSSDVAVINVRQRVKNLAHVMGKVWSLGFSLPELVDMVTAAPARVFGLPGGDLSPGRPADLTVFDIGAEPSQFVDGDGETYVGPGALSVVATVRAGRLIGAQPTAVLAGNNIRFHVLDAPGSPRPRWDDIVAVEPDATALLERLARCQADVPADGEVLQLVVMHLADELALPIDVASTVVRRVFADRDSGNPPGWLLAEQRERRGTEWVVQRINASAVAARSALAGRLEVRGPQREAS
ncbi:hypothetical protein BH10ACT3_BH10ACT3_03480 [soil metagenome]